MTEPLHEPVRDRTRLQPPAPARIGDRVEDVGTPALLVDLDAFEQNVARMQALADAGGVALRPHAKAHKSVAIAQRQMAAGAVGICCQKLSEAYPFAAAGIASIHISNEFVGADKLAMAVELARHVDLSVCVDDVRQVAALAAAAAAGGVRITVLAEADVGQGRCGVDSPAALGRLADAIGAAPSLRFGGLQAYHGGAQHLPHWTRRRDVARRAAEQAGAYVAHLRARGIACPVITGGGSGTAEFDCESGVYTEIQPGSYVFLDAHYGASEWPGRFQPRHGLFLSTTVMSTARAGVAVCDAGLKSLAVDSGLPRVWSGPGSESLRYVAANDEHGVLQVLDADAQALLGSKLWLVPGHCDPTANLHAQYVCCRDGHVAGLWDIAARGLSR
ncbi:DSD1 family PLP-dependent enzyme [Cupriavidus neocaledonicus]|uniref:Alanine racemase n=1 Tax=Cupriavidus neocaledonicus TaxID=1040979 RepID=A0A375HTU7_9BURK|nr:DSD1 family PLP-dependent enzyme [Cupriavidus neocaledonicus]SOZ40343.1 Alanine racemase [Cupriavidus neocaledonicus]SPD60314.1 D-threonine aldolase [Cupriavidus neocaledonicus]